MALVAYPAASWAQRTLVDNVRQMANAVLEAETANQRISPPHSQSRASVASSDKDAARAANKARNDRAYQEMIDMAERQNAQSASGQLPPTAAVPYWHTKQLCTGRDGKKAPCRIYR
jgi:hypothetical protein